MQDEDINRLFPEINQRNSANNPQKPPKPPKSNKRKKRGGLFGFLFNLCFTLFVIAVGWVLIYLFLFPPFTFLMVQRAFEGDKIKYHPVSLSKIDRDLVDSVIASEDSRFCLHNGFEFQAMEKAYKANQKGRKLRGASTISQQTAKNAFLWPARSYVRKGFEAGFTVLIETIWPKRRIMATYLNIAEMGNGVFGAEAASHYYFDKSAKDLTPYEAARIAAILPNPQKYRVTNPGPYIRRRANAISHGARVIRNSGLDKCVYK